MFFGVSFATGNDVQLLQGGRYAHDHVEADARGSTVGEARRTEQHAIVAELELRLANGDEVEELGIVGAQAELVHDFGCLCVPDVEDNGPDSVAVNVEGVICVAAQRYGVPHELGRVVKVRRVEAAQGLSNALQVVDGNIVRLLHIL